MNCGIRCSFLRILSEIKKPIDTVTTYYIQLYYRDLQEHESVKPKSGERVKISPRTIRDVKKVLSPAFQMAVRMGLLASNPVPGARLPREIKKAPPQWTPAEAVKALQNCEDFELLLMISLMISGPLRVEEMLGLRYSDIQKVPGDSVGRLDIRSELTRVNKAMAERTRMKFHLVFPDMKKNCTSKMGLADVKNEYSNRNDFLPPTVMAMLEVQRRRYEEWKKQYGEVFPDYDLVFHQENGRPVTDKVLSRRFHRHITFATMQSVVFRSLRNTGATTQMKVSGNDIKAVQANMGHATADMLLQHYLASNEEDRREVAMQMETEIFSQLDLSSFGVELPAQNEGQNETENTEEDQT